MGLNYKIVKADSGAIGGDASEEFHVLADTGEDTIAVSNSSEFAINTQLLLKDGEDIKSLEGKKSPDGKGEIQIKKGIEVGHIFYFGTKYSEKLGAYVQDNKGEKRLVHMGSYGIGISRLVGAIIEAFHDDRGIIWPIPVAPFHISLINLMTDDDKCNEVSENLYNNLLNKKDSKCELYPLEMNYCTDCHNCQLSVVVDPKKMFSNYLYLSSTSRSFRKHFEDAAEKYIKEFKLSPKKSYVIDIGSNDGVALKPFKDLGFKKILGVEPAKNLAKLANKNKIKTVNCFLDNKNLKKIRKNADIILASNVFAHSDKLKEMMECMLKLLKSNGTIIIEVQYLLNTLQDLTFDNIYHEHYNYWSLTSLVNFFKQFKAKIIKTDLVVSGN